MSARWRADRMARRGRAPVFVDRGAYRLRRWRDAARLLPVAALILWWLPMMWPPGSTRNAAALVYVFTVWAALIVAARLIAPHTLPGRDDSGGEPD